MVIKPEYRHIKNKIAYGTTANRRDYRNNHGTKKINTFVNAARIPEAAKAAVAIMPSRYSKSILVFRHTVLLFAVQI